ncbi:MAG: hypothetical protein FJ399_04605 [Verrucomicrobia bacterium]|nr:hypothetical protein [Verrucomicrobiota bacterium]
MKTAHSKSSCLRNLGRLPFNFIAMLAATALLPALAAAAGAAGEASSVESRLAALERQVEGLRAENSVLRERLGAGGEKNQPISVRPEGRETRISLGGLMQVQGEAGGAPDARYVGLSDRFLLRRMRVAVAGAFAEHMAFKFETDFGNASISNRAGASGQITDASITWTRYPALNLRTGQFKTPFGFEQLVSDPKTLFIERTLSNDRLTVGRQIGALACGELLGPALSYSVGAFNGSGTNNGGNDNGKYLTAGRLVSTICSASGGARAVRWTAAGNFFNTVDRGSFTGRRTGYGADSQFSWGPAQVGAEWLRNENHPVVGLPIEADGWYLYGTWLFSPRWQAVARYEAYDSNLATARTTTREWTLGFNYYLKGDDLKLALNYQLGRPPVPAPQAGRLLGRMQVTF